MKRNETDLASSWYVGGSEKASHCVGHLSDSASSKRGTPFGYFVSLLLKHPAPARRISLADLLL